MVHKRHRMVVLLVAFALVVGVSDEVLVHVGHQVASCVVVVITQEVVDALLWLPDRNEKISRLLSRESLKTVDHSVP
jgi:hypothetical protein